MGDSSDNDGPVTSAFPSNEQDVRRDMNVQGRLLFYDILRHLGLPMAQYKQIPREDGKIYVSIIFQAPALPCHGSPRTVRIDGTEFLDATLAEHTAAVEAIRYMETAANIVVKDLNYNLLEHAHEENMKLRKQLKVMKLKLKNRPLKARN